MWQMYFIPQPRGMSEPPLYNPHDKFFKETLGRATTAAAFFRAYLPPELASTLDWDRLERREGSFVDETLRERHADLLFTVPWKEKEVFLYCLFEHQSEPDRWMAFRLLRYMVRIWEEELRCEPDRLRLSPILPIVLHQGERTWKVANRFRELVEVPESGNDQVAKYVPDFRYHLVDLGEWPIEKLRGGVLVRAIMTTMRAVREGELVERLEDLDPLLSGALRERDPGFVRVCLEYLMRGGDVDLQVFRDSVEKLRIGEIKEDVMTLADQLIQEGRHEGRQEGRREEGLAILRRLLTHRFGVLPEWVERRLTQASTGEFERWSEQLLDARNLESVFEE